MSYYFWVCVRKDLMWDSNLRPWKYFIFDLMKFLREGLCSLCSPSSPDWRLLWQPTTLNSFLWLWCSGVLSGNVCRPSHEESVKDCLHLFLLRDKSEKEIFFKRFFSDPHPFSISQHKYEWKCPLGSSVQDSRHLLKLFPCLFHVDTENNSQSGLWNVDNLQQCSGSCHYGRGYDHTQRYQLVSEFVLR